MHLFLATSSHGTRTTRVRISIRRAASYSNSFLWPSKHSASLLNIHTYSNLNNFPGYTSAQAKCYSSHPWSPRSSLHSSFPFPQLLPANRSHHRVTRPSTTPAARLPTCTAATAPAAPMNLRIPRLDVWKHSLSFMRFSHILS